MTLAARLEKREERLGDLGRHIGPSAAAGASAGDDINAFLDQLGLTVEPDDTVLVFHRFTAIGDDGSMELLMVNPKRA